MAQLYDFPLGVSKQDPSFGKILQMIEDFRGYETLESLKAADDQVKNKLAEQLQSAVDEAAVARKSLEAGTHLSILPEFDRMTEHMRTVREMFTDHYRSKIAACHRYQPDRELVGELYSLDVRILTDANNVYNLMQEFQRMVREDMMLANVHKIGMSLDEIADSMEKKSQIIGCMIE
jgi:hypothetical protein